MASHTKQPRPAAAPAAEALVDPEKCIICQTADPLLKTTSTLNGREKIIKAADIRGDIVLERLKQIDHAKIVYHVSNACYKRYTHPNTLATIEESVPTVADPNEQEQSTCGSSGECRPRRSQSSVPRDPACQPKDVNMFTKKCVICGTARRNNTYEKFRISERPRAEAFLKAAAVLQDEVFTRVCDLQNAESVFAADLYCHKQCIRNYLRKAENLTPQRPPKRAKYDTRDSSQKPDSKSGREQPKQKQDTSDVDFRKCGAILRECFLRQDFDLNDKFCDASELESAYSNIVIPSEIGDFFSALFNVDFESSTCNNTNAECEDDTEQDSSKMRKLLSVYQIIFYILHNGKKRTPLHMMNSESIFSVSRSKTLISSLNRFGLAISYDEILRYHSDMASLVAEMSKDHVPFPSHFSPSQFTIGAFDNFDHEEATLSGIGGSHDTVLILMQDKSLGPQKQGKPNMSETGIIHRERQFNKELICQELRNYNKSSKKPALSAEYEVPSNLFEMDVPDYQKIRNKDTAWTLSRLDVSDINGGINASCSDQRMPTWSAFNSLVTDEEVAQKIIGFLPVLPYPVTEYATVYTALKNFQDILGQLEQSHLPVACDEGVYHIAREIVMNKPSEFNNIILCLGSFHLIKVVLGAIGKYIDGCGAETIFVESGAFGKNVVRSVLDGTHYTRSLKGLTMLSECIERLQWAEFFKIHGVDQYMAELQLLKLLKGCVSEKDREGSKEHLDTFLSTSSQLIADFNGFRSDSRTKSETFEFWDRFVEMVGILRDLVRADREGDWNLHLRSVQAVLPLFAGCDRVNYLRWASVYLEDMRQLPQVSPLVHQNFLAGKFVVKRTEGKFSAVGADMCLEQTINRSQKNVGGVIGNTKRKQFVAQWEIIYHEMMGVLNLQRQISGVTPSATELHLKQEFNLQATRSSEATVQNMMDYVQSHDNPVVVSGSNDNKDKLHNIVTQEIMPQVIRDDLLQFEEKSAELYETFRTERFITKERAIFDTIHRNNVKTFKSNKVVKGTGQPKEKDIKQQLAEAQKIFDVARIRNYDVKHLLKYDLVETSYLFDGEGMMVKPNKSDLCDELEKILKKDDYTQPTEWADAKTTSIMDVMGCLRRMRTGPIKTFGEFCEKFIEMASGLCRGSDRIDLVFDTYVEGSVKESERTRRSSCRPIDLNAINSETKLPVSMDAFWASPTNKTKLQQLLRQIAIQQSNSRTVVVSAMGVAPDMLPCISVSKDDINPLRELDVEIEEADVRLIPHALHAVNHGSTRIVILSNDTDVMVLALHYWDILKCHGLQELWMRAGVANTTRYVPLHILAERLGHETCSTLIAVHHLTGCDSTSKFGTKASALKPKASKYLHNFGKDHNEIDLDMAEEYLCKVYKAGTTCKTLDELRYHLYHHSKKTILGLPPTSRAAEGHIRRAFFGTYQQLHCLDRPDLDPRNFGYIECDGNLQPDRLQSLLPEDFPMPCKCPSCATARCSCRKIDIGCCPYCKCKSQDAIKCKNPLNN